MIGPEYSLEVQAQIPAALCGIHNFIRLHDSEEGEIFGEVEHFNGGVDAGDNFTNQIGIEDQNTVTRRRDNIAWAMWDDYQRILQERMEEQ